MSEHLDSVVSLIREEGIPRVGEWAERGTEKAIDAAHDWITDRGTRSELLEVAREGLTGMRSVAPHLGTLAQSQAAAVLAHVYDSGEVSRVALVVSALELSFAERIAAQRDGSLAVLQAELADQHAWDEIEAALKAIGKDALKAAIPLILAAL